MLAPCSWIEHDPEEIWQGVQECIQQAVRAAEKEHGKLNVKAIGITNQRETTVVWEKASGKPLHNAIVWMDSRTEQICTDMERRFGSKVGMVTLVFHSRGLPLHNRNNSILNLAVLMGQDYFRPVTGLPISTYFSSYKLKWLIDNVPKVSKAVSSEQAFVGESSELTTMACCA